MASTKTSLSPYVTGSNTADPILWGREGEDYDIVRFTVNAADSLKIGDLVKAYGNTTTGCIINDTSGPAIGPIPDTVHNKAQMERDNGSDWSLTDTYSAGSQIDVAIIKKPCLGKATLAATTTTNIGTLLSWGASGTVDAATVGTDHVIGKSLNAVTNGTGTQEIVIVYYP